jgi:hypothetical protein
MAGLCDLVLGHDERGEIKIRGDQRYLGTLIHGRSDSGKSTLMKACGRQDAESHAAMVWIDPHTGIDKFMGWVPKSRRDDVVLLSLVPDEVPMWPVFDTIENRDEVLLLASQLVDTWRGQHGQQSIGVRASDLLSHALRVVDPECLSPLELLSALTDAEFRHESLLGPHVDRMGLDFGVRSFFDGIFDRLNASTRAEWSSVLENKLSIFLKNDWLQRATSGTPLAMVDEGRKLVGLGGFASLGWVEEAVIVGRGRLVLRDSSGHHRAVMQASGRLDEYLVSYRSGRKVRTVGGHEYAVPGESRIDEDEADPRLCPPSLEELATGGRALTRHVDRLRLRRSVQRFAGLELVQRGIRVKEAMHLADLMDDGKIVLVEIPSHYGPDLVASVASVVLTVATMRGYRQLRLPPERQVPVSVYVDEADNFMSPAFPETLEELRKAKVGLTLGLQRLGQMGGKYDAVRRSIIDSVGTQVCLTPGRQEASEIAEILRVPEEQVMGLEQGHMIVAGMSERSGHAAPRAGTFEGMPDGDRDAAMEVREASVRRYYQSPELADLTIRERIRGIMATAGGAQRRSA